MNNKKCNCRATETNEATKACASKSDKACSTKGCSASADKACSTKNCGK